MSGRRVLNLAIGLLLLSLVALSGCSGQSGRANGNPTETAQGSEGDPGGKISLLSDEERAVITIDRDIVYREVDGEDVTLDICRAADTDAPRAALLLIHGGAFNGGDKEDPEWQEMCLWLANAGYVSVNLNYRLAPAHVFPAAIEDVQAAVEWTREQADTYGIDPERIGTVGGSAGGTIAELLGTIGEGSTTQGSRVSSVVSLSGAADLTERALDLGQPARSQIRNVLQFLGCSDIADCPAGEAASPVTHVDPSDPPFFLAHASQDRVPVQQTEVMAQALVDVGGSPEVLITPGQAHASRLLIDVEVQDALLAFLARTLG